MWTNAQAVFPLANIPKKDVRRLAHHYDLPTANRAESMGVCFIGERGRFGDFICTSIIHRLPQCSDETNQTLTP